MAGRPANPRNQFDRISAAAVRIARERAGSVGLFAASLAGLLDWDSLSRQAIYDWETGSSRVPASVLLASAYLAGESLDDLCRLAILRSHPWTDQSDVMNLLAAVLDPSHPSAINVMNR